MTPGLHDHPRLQLIHQARQRVLAEGAGAAGLAPWIERSWQRCMAQGRRPEQRVVFEAVSHAQMRQVQERSQALVQAARPVLEKLAHAMAETRYFAILTDAQGVAVSISGPVDQSDPRARAIARVGIDLSEAAVGTTAIGAALAELQPVWLHRGEHFYADNGSYSCAGAPLWGPDGRCIGMLDLTGIDVPERPALKHLVTLSARNIENALMRSQPHRLQLRLNWPGQTLGDESDGLLCLDAEGSVVAANRAAGDMLSMAPGWTGTHAADLFATPWETLFDAARQGRGPMDLPLWSGLRIQVLATPGAMATSPGRASPAHTRPGMPLRDLETELIRQAVRDAQGNVQQAARALGISRATVYRKLGRHKG